MSKFSPSTIQFLLEAATFKELQSLMLKNNFKDHMFYDYRVTVPNPLTKKWIALYYKQVKI